MTTNAPAMQQGGSIASLLKQQMPAIRMALGGMTDDERQKRADRFVRVCLTQIRNNQKLAESNPMSLMGAIMTSASLNLEIDPRGLAYLVPYKGEIQLQIGYKGLKELAYRTGAVQNIYDEVVFLKEVEAGNVEVSVGLERDLKHKIDITKPELRDCTDKKNPVVLAYAVAVLADGTKHFEFVDKYEVEKRKKSSQSATGRRPEFSPWNTWEAEMWKKTAVKKLARALPQSTEYAEFQRAVALDEQADAGQRQSFDLPEGMIDITPSGQPTTEDLNAKLLGGNGDDKTESPEQDEKTTRTRPTMAEMDERRAKALETWTAVGGTQEEAENLVNNFYAKWTTANCEKITKAANDEAAKDSAD